MIWKTASKFSGWKTTSNFVKAVLRSFVLVLPMLQMVGLTQSANGGRGQYYTKCQSSKHKRGKSVQPVFVQNNSSSNFETRVKEEKNWVFLCRVLSHSHY